MFYSDNSTRNMKMLSFVFEISLKSRDFFIKYLD